MIPVSPALFRLLCMIPFVGSAFSRHSFGFMQSEKGIDVPIGRFAEAFFRVVILGAVIVGGYLAIQPILNQTEVVVTNQQIAESFALAEEEFQEFLKECDRQQLIEVLDRWIIDPSLPLEDRRKVMNNQVLASKKVASSRMNQQRYFGVSKELQLRSEIAMIALSEGTYDAEANKQLLDLADLYISIQFEEDSDEANAVNEVARLGEIIGLTQQLVETGDFKTDTSQVKAVLEKLSGLSEHFLSSSATGQTLSQLSQLARKRLQDLEKSTTFADLFDNALASIHTENKSLRIKELRDMNCLEASAARVVYLPTDEAGFEDRFVKDFRDKLDLVFEVEDISKNDYEIILEKLGQLAESGWPKEALKMVEPVVNSFRGKGDFPELERQSKKLKSRLDWVGENLNTDAMTTLENRKPYFRESNALATIVIYISMKNQKESDIRLKQLIRVYNKIFKNAKIDFVVVFLHEDDQRNGLQMMRVLDDKLKPVDFWQINVSDEKGKAFASNLSIDETPYVKILDADRRVASLNPRPKIVVDILNQLQEKE